MYDIFSNKCALVTGASSGLGRSLVEIFSSHFDKLYVVGRNKDNLDETVRRCSESAEIVKLVIDLLDDDQVHDLLQRVSNDVDVLVNCAGIFPMMPISQTSIEDFRKCMRINVEVPFLLSRVLSKRMKEKGWGRIVNIGSSSAYGGSSETGLYCTSKHALLGLTRSLFLEHRETGVRTFFIAPGSIQTPMGASDERQDYSTFLDPKEVSSFILNTISYDSEMVANEVRLNRLVIR